MTPGTSGSKGFAEEQPALLVTAGFPWRLPGMRITNAREECSDPRDMHNSAGLGMNEGSGPDDLRQRAPMPVRTLRGDWARGAPMRPVNGADEILGGECACLSE
jgi:hypothetical protein